MKNAKKLLSLLLAILMISACFVACDNADDAKSDSKSESKTEEKKEPENEAENEKKAVEAVVEDYFDTRYGKIKDFSDVEDTFEYCVKDSTAYKNIKKLVESAEESVAYDVGYLEISDADEHYVREFYIEYFNFGFDTIDYNIKEIEIKDDKATAKIEKTGIDSEEAWNVMLNALNSYIADYEEGGYDEGYQLVFIAAVDNMEEILADVAIVEEEKIVTLKKVDGKWLIEEIE